MSDKLFRSAAANEWINNAVAGGKYSARGAYAFGYYEAASTLVTIAIQNGTQDILFFPICFNYRHYIELQLKRLIVLGEDVYDVLKQVGEVEDELSERAKSIITTHNLAKLFQLFIERFKLITDDAFDDDIRKTIMQLHNIDPSGQIFRYPVQTNDELSLPDRELFDLANIQRRMHKVQIYLDGTESWMHEQKDQVLELRYELDQYVPDSMPDYF